MYYTSVYNVAVIHTYVNLYHKSALSDTIQITEQITIRFQTPRFVGIRKGPSPWRTSGLSKTIWPKT